MTYLLLLKSVSSSSSGNSASDMGTTNMTFGNGAYVISKGTTNIAEGAGVGQATGDLATLSADSVASASDDYTGGTLTISAFSSKVPFL